MQIIIPFDVTAFTSNIPASTEPEWLIGTAYTVGNTVQISSLHNEYECLINNTGQDPSTNPVDGSGNPYWLDLGAENEWKMFDEKGQNASTNPDSIVVSITPGTNINSVALINFSALTANITVNSPSGGGEVYNEDIETIDIDNITDYYEWRFDVHQRIDKGVVVDLPPYFDATITVTLTDTGSTVSLGELVFGDGRVLGRTTYGTSLDGDDFSIAETDLFGNTFLQVGKFIDTIDYSVAVPANKTFALKTTLKAIRAKPTVYIGSVDKPETIIYGFWEEQRPTMTSPGLTELSLTVQELA